MTLAQILLRKKNFRGHQKWSTVELGLSTQTQKKTFIIRGNYPHGPQLSSKLEMHENSLQYRLWSLKSDGIKLVIFYTYE